MIIKCHLSRLMGEKRITIKDLAIQAGLARNTVASLYHEEAKRVDYKTLAKLCECLGCEVKDILEAVPGEYMQE